MPFVTVRRRLIRQSPQKIRLVSQLVAKRPVDWALQQLQLLPKRAGREVWQALKSAQAAAETKKMAKGRLTIVEIVTGQGPVFKRAMPGPRGRTYRIKKMTSHLRVTVSDETMPSPKARVKS